MAVNLLKQFENMGVLLLAMWLIVTSALHVVGSPDLRSGPLLAELVSWWVSVSWSVDTIQSSARSKARGIMQNLGIAIALTGLLTALMVSCPAAYGDQGLELLEAAHNNDMKQVQQLLEMGADVNSRDQDGATALIEASSMGHPEMVRLLLEKGADVNATDTAGGTALMQASFLGHFEIVKLLLEHRADVNAEDKDGVKALTRASAKGRAKIMDILKAYGAKD